MDLYAFQFDGDTLLLRSASEEMARCRAFHAICEACDLSGERLEQMGWPADGDFSLIGDLDNPVLLDGGE